jgi:hypothetical protein
MSSDIAVADDWESVAAVPSIASESKPAEGRIADDDVYSYNDDASSCLTTMTPMTQSVVDGFGAGASAAAAAASGSRRLPREPSFSYVNVGRQYDFVRMLDDSGDEEDDGNTDATSFLSWGADDEDGGFDGGIEGGTVASGTASGEKEEKGLLDLAGNRKQGLKTGTEARAGPNIEEPKGHFPDSTRDEASREIYWEPPTTTSISAASGRSHRKRAPRCFGRLLRRFSLGDDKNQRRRPMLVVINDFFYFF